jgi:hypothetical protein
MIGNSTQGSSASTNNEIVISTNGNNHVPISGRGTNTCFIDARNGLYAYSPVIAQFTFLNTNPVIAQNTGFLPYYSYGTGGGSVPYFNRGITLTENLNSTIGGYWKFQQLGIYKITVSMKQFTQTDGKTTFIGRTAFLGNPGPQNLGATSWTTFDNVATVSWSICTLITVDSLTDFYFISEYSAVNLNAIMNNFASVLIEYVSVN